MADSQKAVEWSLPESSAAHPLQPHAGRHHSGGAAGVRAATLAKGQESRKGESDEDGEEWEEEEYAMGLGGQRERGGEEEGPGGRGGGGGGGKVQAPEIEVRCLATIWRALLEELAAPRHCV
eukprot:scaffold22334_cov18-Tisochrysis_lutea.AAC.2